MVQKLVNADKASSASGGGLELFLLPEAPLLSMLSAYSQVFPTEPIVFLMPPWSPALTFWLVWLVPDSWLANLFFMSLDFSGLGNQL